MAEQVFNTVCGFCHVYCGMKVRVKDGVMVGVKGDPEHPANRGKLCIKAGAAMELVYSPDRLQYPMKKTGSGFKRVSWEEALDFMATRLGEIREKHGPQAIMGSRGAPVTKEASDGFAQLIAALGSPNATGVGHLCSTPRAMGMNLVFGERPTPDFERTRCMVLWGANPTDSMRLAEGTAYGRYDRMIARNKARGAKLIVIDPRRTELAQMADIFLQIEPGTDRALALAMLHVIIKEGLYDREFVQGWTVGFDRLQEHVETFTPEWAEGKTGVPSPLIEEAARVYASTKPALIREGNGLDMHVGVVQTVQLVGMLIAITGNLDVPGGNVYFPSPPLAPYPTVKPSGRAFASEQYPLFPSVPFPVVVDSLCGNQPERPRALVVHHSNPVLVNANQKKVTAALGKLEFMVVCDIFPTATAQQADLILPDTSDFERIGFQTYGSVQGGIVSLQRKVVEPRGEARSVFEVEYEVARRLGIDHLYPWTTIEEWVNFRLQPSGVTIGDLEDCSFKYVTPPMEWQKYLRSGMPTPTGKAELFSSKMEEHAYEPLPSYIEPPRPPEGLALQFPLLGTLRRPQAYMHTKFRNLPTLKKAHPEPLMRIHPRDAEARGITDAEETVVTSPIAEVRVRAMVTDEVLQGQVHIDGGWGNPWDGLANINALASDEPRDPISSSTPNRRFFCQVKRA
ncbi:MAG: molybdopterin oxidoreductase [Dehalococcoidia bacterium]|nr:molybdopterin oxidoreductase [Dehalococcoidia bacterium]